MYNLIEFTCSSPTLNKNTTITIMQALVALWMPECFFEPTGLQDSPGNLQTQRLLRPVRALSNTFLASLQSKLLDLARLFHQVLSLPAVVGLLSLRVRNKNK